jgi:mRNA interferase MazF
MEEGNVVITPLLHADGLAKRRPAVILRDLPAYQDVLVCGISTQLRQYVAGFDEIISSDDDDFVQSGLTYTSVIRLGFLVAIPNKRVLGIIGVISSERHDRLLRNLSAYLVENSKNAT